MNTTNTLKFVFPSDDEAKVKKLELYLSEMAFPFTKEAGNKLHTYSVQINAAMDAYWLGTQVMEIVYGIKRYQ